MIKRRFYKIDHGERDGAASDESSSSSSDESDVEPQVSGHADVAKDVDSDVNDDVNSEDDDDVSSPSKYQPPSISSSGYESEDSSGNEIDADTTGLITKDDESGPESDEDELDGPTRRKGNSVTEKLRPEDLPVTDNTPNCVLKSKSVFKCRLCPKIVCLNEESLTTHLKSKRHARSEKLLTDGRLKRFLNSDGEEEVVTDDEDGETHAERHARILALAQSQDVSTKKGRGRQRQRQRLKMKKQKNPSEAPSTEPQRENRAKRRRKNVD